MTVYSRSRISQQPWRENLAPDNALKAAFPLAFGSTPGDPGVNLTDMRATRRKATVTLAFTGLEGQAK